MTSRRAIGRNHPLVRQLRAAGWSARSAWRTVNAVFEVVAAALQRHETVEVPFGTFRVVAQTVQPYRRWWRGRPVEFYRNRFRVEFIPREKGPPHE